MTTQASHDAQAPSPVAPVAPGTAPRPWRRGLAWLALLAPLFYLTYGTANAIAARRDAVPSVVFDWEHAIPFWSWTIFPYWTINAFYGLSLLIASTRHELDRHAARLLTAQAVAVAFFIALPLRFSFGAPPVDGAPGWLFDALRSFDQPFNQAPSLHIALALILWDFYRRRIRHPAARAVLHLWTVAICASVLTTWQHHFIDIPTGALLGMLCVWAWPLERRVAVWRHWRITDSARRRQLATRYAAGALALAAAAQALGGTALWLWWPAASLALVALNYLALGERGFQMRRDGRMAWAPRWLLAPYLLGARVNGWIWTRALPPRRPLLPGVAIGSLTRLDAAAIGPRTRLLSLCAEVAVPHGVPAVCLPGLDLVAAAPGVLARSAMQIEDGVRRGEPVLVACALGFSRSAAALAGWLVRSGRAADIDEALARVRSAQPQTVLDADWRDALRRSLAIGRPPRGASAAAEIDGGSLAPPDEVGAADRAQCRTMAALLGAGGRTAGALGLAGALAAVGLWVASPPSWPWAAAVIALVPVERVLALRVGLDARLFAELERGLPMAALDQALAAIGLRSAPAATRPLAPRLAGARRLLQQHAAVAAVQWLLVAAGLATGAPA